MVASFTALLTTILLAGPTPQPDTLRITLAQADSLFQKNSFMVLAAGLNIEAQRAQELQAKLYPNPVFTADFNAYDPENGRPFHVGPTGQMGFQFEQLILLGGKRKAQVELARTNTAIAELELRDLVRQLRYELRTGMHTLNQQYALLRNYNNKIALLDTILTAYADQAAKGNIAQREVVRLKGEYLKLTTDRAALFKELFERQARVQGILQVAGPVRPLIAEGELERLSRPATYDALLSEMTANRPDLQLAAKYVTAAQQTLTLEQKQAIPDLNLFTSYDQRGGAFQNQVNAGFGIPLPLWNRNQGNIRAARARTEMARLTEEGTRASALAELANAHALYEQTVREFNRSKQLYGPEFAQTMEGMAENFRKRNVSLIEFVDFFESYNEALAEQARVRIQLAESAEQLNLTVGKDIF